MRLLLTPYQWLVQQFEQFGDQENVEETSNKSSQMATRAAGSKRGGRLRRSISSRCSSYEMYPCSGILFFTCSIDFMRCAQYVVTPPSQNIILAK
jgi:ATP-dependent protease Clp ATPase subunit